MFWVSEPQRYTSRDRILHRRLFCCLAAVPAPASAAAPIAAIAHGVKATPPTPSPPPVPPPPPARSFLRAHFYTHLIPVDEISAEMVGALAGVASFPPRTLTPLLCCCRMPSPASELSRTQPLLLSSSMMPLLQKFTRLAITLRSTNIGSYSTYGGR